jgi:hypothetical protein
VIVVGAGIAWQAVFELFHWYPGAQLQLLLLFDPAMPITLLPKDIWQSTVLEIH